MIPLKLTLQNFFSYRNVSLDFQGLHTACISGPNGAGKSSLLEAITWALWGESRAKTNDHVILAGANDVRVDFKFSLNDQIYQVIRSHERERSQTLYFQIFEVNSEQFKSLNGKGVIETQAKIISYLKLDYETFINSAYVRQGKADEFMLNKPADRKKILTNILKLDQYDSLSDQAKEKYKEYKLQAQQLESRLTAIEEELQNQNTLETEKTSLEGEIKQTQQDLQNSQDNLQELQKLQSQRQFWSEQIKQLDQQHLNSQQEYNRLTRERDTLDNQLQKTQGIIAREEEINNTYQNLLLLQDEDDSLRVRFQEYQIKQQERQKLEKAKDEQINQLNSKIIQQKTQLEELERQQQEIQKILSETPAIEAGVKQFTTKRQQLQELDRIQADISPLAHRKYKLDTDIERFKAQLIAEIEQVKKESALLVLEISKRPGIIEQLTQVINQLDELEKKQFYSQRVEEKIHEKKLLKQKIEQEEQIYKRDLEERKQKRKLLDTHEATCPLCQSDLDSTRRELVISQMQQEAEQIEESLWSSYEDKNSCAKELNQLHLEAKQLQTELQVSGEIQHKLLQLEAKLDDLAQKEFRLKNELEPLIEQLQQKLEQRNYAVELQNEYAQIIQQITELNYNEQTHSLVRTEVDRLRSYEFKKNDLEKAQEKQTNNNQRRPIIEQKIESLENEIVELKNSSDLQQKIKQLQEEIESLNYDHDYHQSISGQLRKIRDAQTDYQQLQQFKQELPSLENRLKELEEGIKNQNEARHNQIQQIETFKIETEKYNDYSQQIQELNSQIKALQLKLDNLNRQKGSLEQRLLQIKQLEVEHKEKRKNKREIEHNSRIYEELAKAFGKGGIQNLMIENILPHLEVETNSILSRLTQNQLHLQFVTVKNAASGSKKTRETKQIDTLDILISDNNKTRPYEGYSGGEAFRVNFAIRLALSKVLAQRAGTSLQLLIIDEGFGTQDAEGCERLVAAINAIAPDFACILTVTHIPQFKEAFQQRIEVHKTDQGSEVTLFS